MVKVSVRFITKMISFVNMFVFFFVYRRYLKIFESIYCVIMFLWDVVRKKDIFKYVKVCCNFFKYLLEEL